MTVVSDSRRLTLRQQAGKASSRRSENNIPHETITKYCMYTLKGAGSVSLSRLHSFKISSSVHREMRIVMLKSQRKAWEIARLHPWKSEPLLPWISFSSIWFVIREDSTASYSIQKGCKTNSMSFHRKKATAFDMSYNAMDDAVQLARLQNSKK